MTNEIMREARDQAYFRRREKQERTAAEQAAHDKARAAHEEMAKHYQELAGEPDERQQDSDAPPTRPNAPLRAA